MIYERLARSLSSNVPRPWVGEVLERWMKVCSEVKRRVVGEAKAVVKSGIQGVSR